MNRDFSEPESPFAFAPVLFEAPRSNICLSLAIAEEHFVALKKPCYYRTVACLKFCSQSTRATKLRHATQLFEILRL